MVDIWRNKYYDVSLFIYFLKKFIIFLRIDFWFVLFFLFLFIKLDIKYLIKFDYSVILLNINSVLYVNRGLDFWKLNVFFLEDSCFVNYVCENLKNLKGKYKDLEDKYFKWDFIKCEFWGIIIKYFKLKVRKIRERGKELNKKFEF